MVLIVWNVNTIMNVSLAAALLLRLGALSAVEINAMTNSISHYSQIPMNLLHPMNHVMNSNLSSLHCYLGPCLLCGFAWFAARFHLYALELVAFWALSINKSQSMRRYIKHNRKLNQELKRLSKVKMIKTPLRYYQHLGNHTDISQCKALRWMGCLNLTKYELVRK